MMRIWVVVFYISGLYDLRRLRNNLDFLKTLALAMCMDSGILIVCSGGDVKGTIFTELADACFETDDAALKQIEGQIIHHVELEETLRKLVETARTCANDTECLELLEAVEEYEVLCGGTYAFQKK